MITLHTISEWLNSMLKKENKDNQSQSGDDYSGLTKPSLLILLESRDQEIKTLEHLLRGYTSHSNSEVAAAEEEVKEEPELALNKLNRTNIRTIGAVLSNRSRDRDRYKFRPLNKVKSNAN